MADEPLELALTQDQLAWWNPWWGEPPAAGAVPPPITDDAAYDPVEPPVATRPENAPVGMAAEFEPRPARRFQVPGKTYLNVKPAPGSIYALASPTGACVVYDGPVPIWQTPSSQAVGMAFRLPLQCDLSIRIYNPANAPTTIDVYLQYE